FSSGSENICDSNSPSAMNPAGTRASHFSPVHGVWPSPEKCVASLMGAAIESPMESTAARAPAPRRRSLILREVLLEPSVHRLGRRAPDPIDAYLIEGHPMRLHNTVLVREVPNSLPRHSGPTGALRLFFVATRGEPSETLTAPCQVSRLPSTLPYTAWSGLCLPCSPQRQGG